MPHSLQRDPFDDGMQSLIYAMNVPHRVPGVRAPNMRRLGRKIINNARQRPELAKAVSEMYTNEDSWLSNFLKDHMNAAKPAPKPQYFGGSPDEKTVAAGDSINATAEGGGSDNEGGEGGEAGGESESEGEEVDVVEIKDEIAEERLMSEKSLNKMEQVQLLRQILPDTVLNAEAVKRGSTQAVRIFVVDEDAYNRTLEYLKDLRKEAENEIYNNRKGEHIRKVLDFVLANRRKAIRIVPAKFKYFSPPPKKASTKKSKNKNTPATPATSSTPANTAIAASLSNSGGAESAV